MLLSFMLRHWLGQYNTYYKYPSFQMGYLCLNVHASWILDWFKHCVVLWGLNFYGKFAYSNLMIRFSFILTKKLLGKWGLKFWKICSLVLLLARKDIFHCCLPLMLIFFSFKDYNSSAYAILYISGSMYINSHPYTTVSYRWIGSRAKCQGLLQQF